MQGHRGRCGEPIGPPRSPAGRRRRAFAWPGVLVWSALAVGVTAAGAQLPGGGSRLLLQSGQSSGVVSKDALGRPCLDVEAASRAHAANPNVYDHVFSVQNRCLKPIKLRLCYMKSERCTDVDVSGLKRKDVVLGIYPGLREFRYTFSERK